MRNPTALWRKLTALFATMICAAQAQAASGPPVILTPPTSQSVTSGVPATLQVVASGNEPISYQWYFNGRPRLYATSNTLTINSVSFTNGGKYQVVASNFFGVVTSQVATLTVDPHLTFRILSLTTNSPVVVDESTITGLPRGGLALSSNYVFATGGGANNNSALSARYDLGTLQNGTSLTANYDALVYDLRSGKVYTLAYSTYPLIYYSSGGYLNYSAFNSLIEIDQETGALTPNRITLPRNISMSSPYRCAIFSGYGRLVVQTIYNSVGHLYDIALPSGQVTDLGSYPCPSYNSPFWVTWGIAEYGNGRISTVYAQSPNNIMRTSYPGGDTSDCAFFQDLGQLSSVGFSPSSSRWFFAIPSASQFANYSSTLGSAEGSFTTNAGYPVINAEPLPQTMCINSNTTLKVVATGMEPINYQWYFNGEVIANATNDILVLNDVQLSNVGLYNVWVSNPLGNVASAGAYLDVMTLPRINTEPMPRSVMQGSNTVLAFTVDGPGPITYSWQHNGDFLPDTTTSPTLQINDIQTAQAGFYTLIASNRFGMVNSSPIEVFVALPVDYGTDFQITSMTNTPFSVIETYNIFSMYECNPIAVTTNSVFFSSGTTLVGTPYRTARANSSDLGGLSAIERYYFALISNLRTERAYVLGTADGPLTNDAPFTATALFELDSTTGALGQRIDLSQPIPNINDQDMAGVGFFSGYDRAVVLNGSRAYNIALPSGVVTDLGFMTTPAHASDPFCSSFWGVAEHKDGLTYLVFGKDPTTIGRVRVPDGMEMPGFTFANLSLYMNSVSASIRRGRWYFENLTSSEFSSFNSSLGFAPATFDVNSGIHLDHFEWASVSSPVMVNAPFQVTLYARNSKGLPIEDFNGSVSLSATTATGTSIQLAPTSVTFTNGSWTGFITALQANTNIFLQARDAEGNTGKSSSIRVNPMNDLGVFSSVSATQIVVGNTLTYSIRVTNSGPDVATGVILTNSFGSSTPTFVSFTASQGSCSNANGVLICDLGAVTNVADVTLVIQPVKSGILASTAKIGRNEVDPYTGNNAMTVNAIVVLPILAIQDARLTEGDSGTNYMIFNVTLTPATNMTITVNYATSVGSATCYGAFPDFLATSGKLIFAPYVTNQTIEVPIVGDTVYEVDETFTVTLSGQAGGSIGRKVATGTIVNDDPIPVLTLSDVVTLAEGDTGSTTAVFNISLSSVTGAGLSFNFATSNGTATAGSDYVATNGTIIFGAESTELNRTISVIVNSDTKPEWDETLYLVLTGLTNVLAPQTVATCTIVNDDGIGVLDHFTWSSISSPQAVDAPFRASITAMDFFDQALTNYTGPANLSAWIQPPAIAHTMLDELIPENLYTGTEAYTIGYYFTPTNDIVVTHVHPYTGRKVSIWTDGGVLLASQDVATPAFNWASTPLSTPLPLQANKTYFVGFYTSGQDQGFGMTMTFPRGFPNGYIGSAAYRPGDGFPTNNLGTSELYVVDLVYEVAQVGIPSTMEPTVTGTFTDGIWVGKLRVNQPGTNVYLVADDGAGHTGKSSSFDVKRITDLAVSMAMPSGPVGIGFPMSYSVTIQNNSSRDASGIVVISSLPTGLDFISAQPYSAQGTVRNGNVICLVGNLAAGQQTNLTIYLRPQAIGDYTINVSVQENELDMFPDDNQTSGAFTAQLLAPIITASPVSLSVTSGMTAEFRVTADGAMPLDYQWYKNNAPIPGGTNTILVLTNICITNNGSYTVRVSNQYGSVTSDPAYLYVDDYQTFQVLQFTTNNLVVLNEQPFTGYGKAGIAVSSNYVLVTGRGNGSGAAGARHALDLSGGTQTGTGYDGLAYNLRDGKMYCLANNYTPVTYTNNNMLVSTANSLLEIDENTGQPTGNRIVLSQSIPLSFSYYAWNGVFSGMDRIVVQGAYVNDGYHIYDIALPSGEVRDLGPMSNPSTTYTYGCFYFGLAEYFGGSLYLLYPQSSYSIVRRRVPDGQTTTVATWDYLGYYTATIGFSVPARRWYFSIPYDSQWDWSGYNTLVSGTGDFTTDPNYPSIVQQPSYTSVYVEMTASLGVQATARGGGLNYQWKFNGTNMPGETNSMLVMTNVQPYQGGYYSVVVSNSAGAIESQQAYLYVISYPYIDYDPQSVSCFEGSNATLSVWADGARPLYYQWMFNGTNIVDATNSTLYLTNLSSAQAGGYSVMVSNRFGRATSGEATLYVIVIHDDGSVFRVDLTTNNARIIGQNNVGGDDRGGIGVSSSYVFYNGDSGTIRASLDDLSGLTSLGTSPTMDGIACDLRSEIAYVLASGNTRISGSYISDMVIDTLLELNPDGSSSGRKVTLSKGISMSNSYGEPGVFSSYGRIVIHNTKNVYSITLPSGVVTDLGPMPTPSHYNSESWAYWGIAEFWGGCVYLNYVDYNYRIMRLRVPDGQLTTNHAFGNLSDMCSFTASLSRKRWYFHYEYQGEFGGDSNGSNETLGYADAIFTIFNPNADHFEWDPISSPLLSGIPFEATIKARNTTNGLVTNYCETVSLKGLNAKYGTNVLITPTEIIFTNGIWSGLVTVLQANTNMYLRAIDVSNVGGNSTNLYVKPSNDIAIQGSGAPIPVVVGQNITYSWRITNTGPDSATGVVLTNTFTQSMGTPVFVSATASQGECSNASGVVICSLGTVSNYVDVTVIIQTVRTGSLSSTAKIGRDETDADLLNNSASVVATVVQPILAIQDASITEGNSGTSYMTFNVTLTPASTNTVSVKYTTGNSNAFWLGAYPDYVATSGTLSFSPGITNQSFTVPILGDTMYEQDEVFTVTLSGSVYGYIGRKVATGTIINDDPLPVLSVSDVTLAEGNTGTTTAVFNVTLSSIPGAPVAAYFCTSNGTAIAGSDYVVTEGTLIYGAETTDLARTLSVVVNGDRRPDPNNKTFSLVLTALSNMAPARVVGLCTILDDDTEGVVNRFIVSPLRSLLFVDAPFFVSLKAEDYYGTLVSNFGGTVKLTANQRPLVSQSIFGASAFTSSSGGKTVGYDFTPTNDIVVTDFRHLSGSRISLWTNTETLLATKVVTSTPNTWVTSRLDAPVHLRAGGTYTVGLYDESITHLCPAFGNHFANGLLGTSRMSPGDTFPSGASSWDPPGTHYAVDMVYVGPGTPVPIAMTPTNAAFVKGQWSGFVTFPGTGTNVVITVDDNEEHTGQSEAFDISHDPHVNWITINGTELHCSFHGNPGSTYRLEQTGELSAWANLQEFTVGTNETVEFTCPVPQSSSSQFYRIKFISAP